MRRIGYLATLAFALALTFCATAAAAPPATAATATDEARALFDEYWQWLMREYPGYATYLGDHRYDDRVTDESPAAVARRRAYYPAIVRRLDRIDSTRLSPEDRTSLAVLKFSLEKQIAIDRLFGAAPYGVFDDWAPVTQMNGIHHNLPELVKATRFATVRDYENYVKRLDALPVIMRHLIERMQAALAAGWVLPKIAIAGVPKQLEAQVDPDPEKSPEYTPFKAFPTDIAPADRERFDLRRFHNVVIDGGSVPLVVLEGTVDAWIASERKRTK
jgi:uncharacterized protein (DUF885 family)